MVGGELGQGGRLMHATVQASMEYVVHSNGVKCEGEC